MNELQWALLHTNLALCHQTRFWRHNQTRPSRHCKFWPVLSWPQLTLGQMGQSILTQSSQCVNRVNITCSRIIHFARYSIYQVHRYSFALHRIVKVCIYQLPCSICILSVPCLPPMPPKSTLWQHFCTNKTCYKGDKTHNNAWCKGCIASYVNERTQADTLALTEPSPSPPFRSVAELENEGQCRAGRFWNMIYWPIHHHSTCGYQSNTWEVG